MFKTIDDKPTKPGTYEIHFDGIRSFVAMYADFDGENWDLSDYSDFISRGYDAYWYDNGSTEELN